MKKAAKLKNSVFIVESLSAYDEQLKRFEGDIPKRTLALCGKSATYAYVRTKTEFMDALARFGEVTEEIPSYLLPRQQGHDWG